jgi:hypothetical protein
MGTYQRQPKSVDWNLVWPLVGLIVSPLLFIVFRTPSVVVIASILLWATTSWLGIHLVDVYGSSKFLFKLGVIILSLGIAVCAAWTGWPPTALRDMDNQELKATERELATKMRALENDQFKRMDTQANDGSLNARDNGNLVQDEDARFQQRNIGAELAMRCELLRREDEPCYAPEQAWFTDSRLIALTGRYAGIKPISEVANYLDELANKLQ